MQFKKLQLFIILLLSLIFCGCLGSFFQEGFSSRRSYTGPEGNTATATTGPQGNTAVAVTGSAGSDVVATNNNNVNGINYSDIQPGQQDLYILKSQIVPPVCPVCPSSSVCPRQTPCQPCPPCARCPEPAFDCKKVPNYASSNDNYLPRPIMSDFSQFGM